MKKPKFWYVWVVLAMFLTVGTRTFAQEGGCTGHLALEAGTLGVYVYWVEDCVDGVHHTITTTLLL